MKHLILTSLIFLSAAAQAQIHAGVYTELRKFRADGVALSEQYIDRLPKLIDRMIKDNEEQFASANANNCIDFIKITYFNEARITDDPSEAAKNFESSFLKIENAFCFEGANADQIITKMSSLDFKKKAFSSVKSITPREGGIFCEHNSITFAGESSACYINIIDISDRNYSKILSFNIWNDSENSKYDLPVYFREGLATARQMGNKTQLHAITFVRGKNVSGIMRFLSKGFIESAQKDVMKVLKAELK